MLRIKYEDSWSMTWTNTHDKDKVRGILYNEAWNIIIEMLWRSDSDFMLERQHERLAMIKDAIFVLDQMEKH